MASSPCVIFCYRAWRGLPNRLHTRLLYDHRVYRLPLKIKANSFSTMSLFHLVFVYGTLRTDKPNHPKLLDPTNGQARYLGLATTLERYPLVIASRYNIPYLLAAPGHGQYVRGEVFEVDDNMLEKLDALEYHPKYYERKIRKVKLEESGKELECWLYLLHQYQPNLLELPFLDDYCSVPDDDPDKRYIPSHLREVPGKEYWTDVKLDEGSA